MIPQANITAWRAIAPWANDAQVEQNLHDKEADPAFMSDIGPLLRPGLSYDAAAAIGIVKKLLVELLPGNPWRGTAIEKLSKTRRRKRIEKIS